MQKEYAMSHQVTSTFKSIAVGVLCIIGGLTIGSGGHMAYLWLTAPPDIISIERGKHFANTKEDIIIYVTQWCPYCKQLKAYLKDKNISYLERDIESSDENILALYNSIGSEGIPKIIIGDIAINGFNKAKLEEELIKLNLIP